jgi:O-antigen/teichoic acid export membrane protein
MESVRRDIGEVSWVALPKILAGAVQVVINLALLRRFGPDAFGVVTVCISMVMLADSLLGSAIDMSIFRLAPAHGESDHRYSLAIQKAGLQLKIAGGLMAALPLAVLSGPLARVLFQRAGENSVIFCLALVALLGCLVIRSTQVNFQIERRFSRYGMTDLANTFLRFGPIGVMTATGAATPFSVMLIYALAPFAVAVPVLFTWARGMTLSPSSRPARKELLGTLRIFLATVVAGALLTRLDLFIVSAKAGVREAGIYSAAQILALIPQLLGLYMSAAFSARVMPLWLKGSFAPIYRKYQVALFAAAIAGYIVAAILLPFAGPMLFPGAFSKAGGLILVLLPAGLAHFVSFPWTIPFLLYLRARTMLLLDCAGLPILACALYLFAGRSGAAGAARVCSVFTIVRAAIHQWMAFRIIRLQNPVAAGKAAAAMAAVEGAV